MRSLLTRAQPDTAAPAEEPRFEDSFALFGSIRLDPVQGGDQTRITFHDEHGGAVFYVELDRSGVEQMFVETVLTGIPSIVQQDAKRVVLRTIGAEYQLGVHALEPRTFWTARISNADSAEILYWLRHPRD